MTADSPTVPQWMLEAATELSTLDEVRADGPEDWHFDLECETVTLPANDCDDYGWSVSQYVRTLTCTSGRSEHISYLLQDGADLKDEARRLMRAAEAYWA